MENATRGKIVQNIAKMISLRDKLGAKVKSLVPSKESHNYYPRDERGNQIAPTNTEHNSGEVYTPRTRYYTPKTSEASPMKLSAQTFTQHQGQFDDAEEGDNEQFYDALSSPRRGNSIKVSSKSSNSDISNFVGDENFSGLNDFDEEHSQDSTPDLTRSKSTVSLRKQNSTIFKPRNSAFTGAGNFGAYGV